MIRTVDIVSGETKVFAGNVAGNSDGVGTDAKFREPYDVSFLRDGDSFLVADYGNSQLRHVRMNDADVSTVHTFTTAQGGAPRGVAISPDGRFAVVSLSGGAISKVVDITSSRPHVTLLAGGVYGLNDGIGAAAQFQVPVGLLFHPNGSSVFIAGSGSHRIRQLDLSNLDVTTLVGTTPGYTDGYAQLISKLWMFCTGQDLTCYCMREIRFGTDVGDRWSSPMQPITITPTSRGRPCTIEEFGIDPAPGEQKFCECASPKLQLHAPASIALAENAVDRSLPGTIFIADLDNNVIRSRILECVEFTLARLYAHAHTQTYTKCEADRGVRLHPKARYHAS